MEMVALLGLDQTILHTRYCCALSLSLFSSTILLIRRCCSSFAFCVASLSGPFALSSAFLASLCAASFSSCH